VGAFVITSLFYSAIHFVKPAEKISLSALDAWAGIRHLVYSFQPFLDPLAFLPGLFGLFLIGIVLSYAFLRTGSLYLSIGLHAGWIFGIKTIRVFGDYRREDLGWLFGSSEPKLISGVAGWLGIVAVGVIVHTMTRNRQTEQL
jgi:membrane protease YdiL (CAAX protease family)